jgi:PAS domain S-box-containing protein
MVKGGSADREHGRAGSRDRVPGDRRSDDVGPDGGSRRGAPFRRYSLIIAASIVPLVIAIVVLTGYQFVLQRERLLEELQNEAVAHDVLLASVTKSIGDHVRSLGIWAQIYLAKHEPGREVGDDRAASGGERFVRGRLADRPGATTELGAARRLEPHMRLAHQAMPYLRRSYYLSGGEDLAYVYPLEQGIGLSGRMRGASNDQILDLLFAQEIFQDARRAGSTGGAYWTRAYVDPEGAWVVGHATPIGLDADALETAGVVGSTVLVDFLTGFLRAFDYPGGQLWLVNQHAQVLASSELQGRFGRQVRTLQEALPAGLRDLSPATLLQPSDEFREIGDQYLLAQPVASTPWTLLFIVSSAELNQVLLPRFIPYGVILLGLILTLLLTHVLRQRLLVRPALGLADYIKAESLDQHPVQPPLPALWRPWLRAVADAFAAKRQALAQIADSEAIKSAIIDTALDGLITIDEHSIIVEFNPAAEQLFGIERKAAVGQPMAELIIPPHMRAQHHQGMRRYLAGGPSRVVGRRIEIEALRADGRPFPVDLAISEVRQAGRRLFTAYIRDITERRRMERVLRESEQYFKTIAEAHPVAVCITRLEDRRILHASKAFADLFGVPLAALPGQDVQRFYHDVKDRDRLIRLLREQGAVDDFELPQRRADGTVFPTMLSSRLIEFQGQRAIVSGILDLTRQKQAEAEIARQREALRENERRFRTIAEAHPVPVCIVRRGDRRILYASQRFADLVGMSLEQVYQTPHWSFYPDAEERERLSQALRQDDAIRDQEATIRRADGSTFPAAIAAQVIDYEGEDAAIFGVMDLSAQKEAESEIVRQREALHQSEKLSALGSLLAGVAHELNNPLSVVVGYASMLRDSTADPTTRERAERIHAAATRCSRIVKSYLAIARKKPAARTAVQINGLIEAALEFTSYGLRTGDVKIVRDLAADLPELMADGDQMIQVFMNLIVNAHHALQRVAPPRRLRISTRREQDGIRIEVADNGPGVPAALASEIFEPFFTTKPQGVGTGIGLSVSRGIVTDHGGEIEVAGAPGGGAVFIIKLPVTEVADKLPIRSEVEPPCSRKGRIMVVDDEVEIGEMLAETLRRDGHETIVAVSGRDALAKLDDHEVDMIISDLRMPDLDGPALHRELSRIRPDLAARTLFVTGDTLAADATGFLSETGLPVIDKPIDPNEVRRRVQAFLAGVAPS